MKLTILLGYAKTDAHGNGLGPAKIISGPPADESEAQAQARVFTDAKQLHQFPKGIRHVAYGTIDIADRAAFISDEVADQIEGRQQKRMVDLEIEEKRRADEKEKSNTTAKAKARLSAAAVAHNNSNAKLQTAKNRALDCEANWKQGNKTAPLTALLDEARAKAVEFEKLERAAWAELQAAKEGKPSLINEQGLFTNGPTIGEYITAGYNPVNYPPRGYAAKSTPEEVATACQEYAKKQTALPPATA